MGLWGQSETPFHVRLPGTCAFTEVQAEDMARRTLLGSSLGGLPAGSLSARASAAPCAWWAGRVTLEPCRATALTHCLAVYPESLLSRAPPCPPFRAPAGARRKGGFSQTGARKRSGNLDDRDREEEWGCRAGKAGVASPPNATPSLPHPPL